MIRVIKNIKTVDSLGVKINSIISLPADKFEEGTNPPITDNRITYDKVSNEITGLPSIYKNYFTGKEFTVTSRFTMSINLVMGIEVNNEKCDIYITWNEQAKSWMKMGYARSMQSQLIDMAASQPTLKIGEAEGLIATTTENIMETLNFKFTFPTDQYYIK